MTKYILMLTAVLIAMSITTMLDSIDSNTFKEDSYWDNRIEHGCLIAGVFVAYEDGSCE